MAARGARSAMMPVNALRPLAHRCRPQCLVASNTGQKSACSLHIISVLIAKPRNQILFFSSAPDHEQRENQTASDKEKPICCSERVGDNGQGERGIERMSNPTVGTGCHQCVLPPGNYGVSQVSAKGSQGPSQQHAGNHT